MTFGHGFDAIDGARINKVSITFACHDEGDSWRILIFSDRYHSSDAETALDLRPGNLTNLVQDIGWFLPERKVRFNEGVLHDDALIVTEVAGIGSIRRAELPRGRLDGAQIPLAIGTPCSPIEGNGDWATV
ncbi:hypothetical protein [Bradyrhizobium sp. UNPA324]|uniref:hypothetical protein n=1 Tax=Bradyrhizobium sp. UNPA324 TaxID=1141174 RepID=UPI0011743F0B|nr:hypothetical protein [Bradyrhizobium sp. UNPA324]TQF29720.1 hypothetical protein UNPA324_08860 [Bradyrhizobium sp. UNPA324]